MELLAFPRHHLGAAAAKEEVVVADAALWIWDRLNWVERRRGCRPLRWSVSWTSARRRIISVWRWRRRGWPGHVVEELERLGKLAGGPKALSQPVAYLRKHMMTRHLDDGR